MEFAPCAGAFDALTRTRPMLSVLFISRAALDSTRALRPLLMSVKYFRYYYGRPALAFDAAMTDICARRAAISPRSTALRIYSRRAAVSAIFDYYSLSDAPA